MRQLQPRQVVHLGSTARMFMVRFVGFGPSCAASHARISLLSSPGPCEEVATTVSIYEL